MTNCDLAMSVRATERERETGSERKRVKYMEATISPNHCA